MPLVGGGVRPRGPTGIPKPAPTAQLPKAERKPMVEAVRKGRQLDEPLETLGVQRDIATGLPAKATREALEETAKSAQGKFVRDRTRENKEAIQSSLKDLSKTSMAFFFRGAQRMRVRCS